MVTFSIQQGKLFCLFSGKLDTVLSMQIENTVNIEILKAKKPVVFDLKAVDYISSGFIRICMQTMKAVGKDNFSVINADEFATKAFKIAGLEQFLRKD